MTIKTINREIKTAPRKKTNKPKTGELVIDNVEDDKYLKMCSQKRGRNEEFLNQVVEDIKNGKDNRKGTVSSPRSNTKKVLKSLPLLKKYLVEIN